MIIFTRMGWIVAAFWLGAVALCSQIPPEQIAAHGMGLSRVAAMFLLAAALSAPLIFIAGKILNRDKVPRTIVRYGKERTVNWGTHTFYMLPVEFWALMIPAFTLVFWVIFSVA